MKVFGVDTALKWINFEMEGKRYSIHFKNNWFAGITQVEVYADGKRKAVKTESEYPPFLEVAKQIRQIWFPVWFRNLTKKG